MALTRASAFQVSPVNLKTLAYVLEVEGFDAAAALNRCGFDSINELDDHGPWLPASLLDELMAAAMDVTADPCFGLIAGKSKGLMRYVALVQVTLVAPTLRQMLDDIARFAPLYLERSEMGLEEQRGSARIVVEPVVTAGRSGHFRTELVATSAFQAVRFARGGLDDIYTIDFPYACPPGQAGRYAATFGPAVRFGCRRCVVEFNPGLLDLALQTHDPVAYFSARSNAEAALAAQRSGLNLAERVRRWLLQALPHQPSAQETAERLRMTERSLRRQLCALGLSYAELTQQSQQLIAKHLLANPELPIKQVAEKLGFSSPASFHRAFRRWTDMTPLAWRERGSLMDDPVAPGQ